jgi:phosphate:Na+ symporter
MHADDKVDLLQQAILEYLGKMRGQAMSEQETEIFQRIMNATMHLETAGDIVESELVPLLRRFIDSKLEPSSTTREMLTSLNEIAVSALERAIDAVTQADENLAQEVISMKPNLRRVVDEIYQRQSQHLGEVGVEDIATVRLEMELSERLQRLYTVARRLAKQVLPTEVALKAD